MIARRAHVEVAGGDRAVALGGVEAVDLGVVGVVEEVGAAGGEAEADERDQRLQEGVALVEHAGRGGRREHEDVLGPLLRTGGADDRPQRRPAGDGLVGAAAWSGRGGSGTADIGARVLAGSGVVRAARDLVDRRRAGRRLRPEWLRRSTRARATTAAPACCTAGASARTRRARRLRRGRRGGLRARPRPRRDRTRLRARRAAGPAAARAVRRRCRAGDRAREPRQARARGVAHHRGDGRSRSSRSSTTSPRATNRRPSSCCPGENRVAAALDLARTVVRRAERQAVAAADDGWLDRQPGRAVPQPTRRSRATRSPAGRRARSAPSAPSPEPA